MNRKLKVMTVFGTRPDAIKMAPLIKELSKRPQIELSVCSTGQHKEMLDQVLQIFRITPDIDLQVMKQRQTLEGVTAKILEKFSVVLQEAKPDLVLVHGDTVTCFACALTCFFQKVRCGHVEAGLRSFDRDLPYPEEMNRVLTGRLATLHFAPTPQNKQHLLDEQVDPSQIFITGNTAIDVVKTTVKQDYRFRSPYLRSFDFCGKRLLVVSAHRRENIGKPLQNICDALMHTVNMHTDVHVIYAVHLNPAVRDIVMPALRHERIDTIDPLDVWDMHNLIARCHMVVTDSGGLQEESPAMGKPVLVLRNETERQEAVAAGTVRLIGTETARMIEEIDMLLNDSNAYRRMATAKNPYGDGHASKRIAEAIDFAYGRKEQRPNDFCVGK